MLLCERLHDAEVVRLRETGERLPVGRVRIRSSSKFYLPPELQPGESLFPKDDYLFKTLKQLLNHTRKMLEPRENWSRADDDGVDYKNDDETYINKRSEGNANLQNSNKKRKKNKKCKCECEKDLIIKVPKYKYVDVPLGKEVSSKHFRGDRYDSSPADGQSTFESMQPDQDPKESTRINQVNLKRKHENSFVKRDDYGFRKQIKSRLPEKNLNYVKRRYNVNRKRSNVKKPVKRQQSRPIRRKLDDSPTEYADSTNEEPVDFIYNGDYLDRSDESDDPKREDYNQYIDFDSQDDVDIVEDYDSDENLTENKSVENFYDAEQI